jgi:hypothetical protein
MRLLTVSCMSLLVIATTAHPSISNARQLVNENEGIEKPLAIKADETPLHTTILMAGATSAPAAAGRDSDGGNAELKR